MHNAFLNIDNRKMSKSLGNFRTVREISEQYDLQVLRFFMLNAHYRSPLNFSADLMEAAKNALERITDAAANLKDRKAAAQTETATDVEKELLAQAQEFVKKFEEAMDDDSTQQMHWQQSLNWLNLQIQMYQRQVPQNLQEHFLTQW